MSVHSQKFTLDQTVTYFVLGVFIGIAGSAVAYLTSGELSSVRLTIHNSTDCRLTGLSIDLPAYSLDVSDKYFPRSNVMPIDSPTFLVHIEEPSDVRFRAYFDDCEAIVSEHIVYPDRLLNHVIVRPEGVTVTSAGER